MNIWSAYTCPCIHMPEHSPHRGESITPSLYSWNTLLSLGGRAEHGGVSDGMYW